MPHPKPTRPPPPSSSSRPSAPGSAKPWVAASNTQLKKELVNVIQSIGLPVSASDLALAAPKVPSSTNKNTLKNKARRLEKHIKDPAAFKAAPEDPQAAREIKIAAQKYAEENAKKFQELARSLSGTRWFARPEAAQEINEDDGKFQITQQIESHIKLTLVKAETLLNALVDRSLKAEDARADAAPGSDEGWMKKVMVSGTLSDRVAAMTLAIQQNPLIRLNLLERLIHMAQKRGKRESLLAVEALRDLFLSDLLPRDRPLKAFAARKYFRQNQRSVKINDKGEVVSKAKSPAPAEPSDNELMFWLFEDRIKHFFGMFLQIMEAATHDPMPHVKKAALSSLYTILSSVAERERQVLALLVNKLGDPDRKVASRVVYLLTEILRPHPQMKAAIVRELEQLLYRPNIAPRAQYFAIIYCNQLIFTQQDKALARKLIELYFNLFKTFIKKNEAEEDQKEKSGDVSGSGGGLTNRFLGGLLTGINRALPFAGSDLSAFAEQIELLFKLIHTSNWNTAIQSLMLLFQLIHIDTAAPQATGAIATNAFISRFYRVLYEQLLSSELIHHTKKQSALFLNLLYKAIKRDDNFPRVCAFIKRAFQVALHAQPNFIAGLLMLVAECAKQKPALQSLFKQSEKAMMNEEEKFIDVADDAPTAAVAADGAQPAAYDPTKRTPEFAQANLSCAWELNLLLTHYHPSVVSFSESLLALRPLAYAGDPLGDFTPMAFLDKFAFKNPKKVDEDRAVKSLAHARKIGERAVVQASSFKGKAIENVREEDLFLYQYFTQKASRAADDERGKDKEKESQGEEEDEEEFANRVILEEMERLSGKADVDEEIDEDWEAPEGPEDDDGEEEGEDGEQWGEDFEESDEGEDAEEGGAGEGIDFGAMDGIDEDEEFSMNEDEEDEDDDDDDDEDDIGELLSGKGDQGVRSRGRRVKDSNESVFASAEEFSSLLADNADEENAKEARHIDKWQRGKEGDGRGKRKFAGKPNQINKRDNKKRK